MAEPQVRRVAVVLFDGFTVLDVYGPVQAFASTRIPRPDGSPRRLFEIVTVAEKAGPVRSGEGPGNGLGPPGLAGKPRVLASLGLGAGYFRFAGAAVN